MGRCLSSQAAMKRRAEGSSESSTSCGTAPEYHFVPGTSATSPRGCASAIRGGSSCTTVAVRRQASIAVR